MYCPALKQRSADPTLTPRFGLYASKLIFELRRNAEGRRRLKQAALLWKRDLSKFRLAKSGCRFDQRVEHSLQIEGGAADDLEHVGGGDVLVQGVRWHTEQREGVRG